MRNGTSPLDDHLQRVQNEEDLKSDWKRGDRVRITSGPLRGEIGKVISASPNSVTVLTDNGEKMQVGSEDVVQNDEAEEKKNFDPAQLKKWVEFQYFKADLSEGQIATIISKDAKNRMSYREALEFVEGVVASAH